MLFENGELPDGLLEAHRSGRLVLFVGAGASAGPPTCLPDFACLAKRVIAELEANRELAAADHPEFVLGELAADGLGVHAAVHRIIGEASQPNPTHGAIAELAQSSPPVPIVTTNYDRLLSASLGSGIPEYTAPDLPGDEALEGIVYLHGSVDVEPTRLIVTRSDSAAATMPTQPADASSPSPTWHRPRTAQNALAPSGRSCTEPSSFPMTSSWSWQRPGAK